VPALQDADNKSLPLGSVRPVRSTIISGQAQKPKIIQSTTFSEKSASVIDRSRLPQTFSAKPSLIGSGIQNHTGDIWIPSPPKNLKHGAKEFECPICFIIQPIEKGSGDKWE
jgi:hypothetical protein